MGKKRRRFTAVSNGALNPLEDTGGSSPVENPAPEAAQTAEIENPAPEGGEDKNPAPEGEGAAEAAPVENPAPEGEEGIVSGFVPNPTIMLVRLVARDVVVPVCQVHTYRYRRGMKVRVWQKFNGWRLYGHD